ncbi:MAG: hypothetical protein FWG10_02710 [Eubacteriaceae bacterium]|nr:hypothetical protein [Eubacteriaceae bacterium]
MHERDVRGAIDSPQTVEIHLNLIGEYIPPTMERKKPTPIDKAEQEEILKRRAKYRRAYERGVQKKYSERTKNRKRAQYDAEKAALLAEDYTLGANFLTPAALPMAANQ